MQNQRTSKTIKISVRVPHGIYEQMKTLLNSETSSYKNMSDLMKDAFDRLVRREYYYGSGKSVNDSDFLKKLLLSFMEQSVEVIITPQMDETRPWLITVQVPTIDGSEPAYFTDTSLELALQKALDEYDRRNKARDVLAGPLKHGMLKRDDK